MSFRLRLIITIVLLIALTFSLGGSVLLYTSFQTTLDTEVEVALESFQNVMRTLGLFGAFNEKFDTKVLGNILQQMTDPKLTSWQAVSLTVSGKPSYSRERQLLTGEFSETENLCKYIQTEDSAGHGLLVEGTIKANDHVLQLQGRFDISGVYELHGKQQKMYVAIYMAVLLFAVLITTPLSYTLTRKLRKLTTAVNAFSSGSLDARSEIRSADEFGQLSHDFNAMAERLEQTIGQLEENIQQQEIFMGNFAHELKTPMTSIIGFADLLQQGNLDENTRMMAAQYIYSEGHRLERLSFKLLDLLLLKKDEMIMKPVNLPGIVGEVDKALRPVLNGKGIELVERSTQGTCVMEADLIKSLLYNLIDNASKAMEKGGTIVLKADKSADGCIFQVIDNGQGMEEDQLSKITEAFYRVDKARSRAQGGAGLGLALCKKIVELHNGKIHFESKPGQGTTVKVILPGEEGSGDEVD